MRSLSPRRPSRPAPRGPGRKESIADRVCHAPVRPVTLCRSQAALAQGLRKAASGWRSWCWRGQAAGRRVVQSISSLPFIIEHLGAGARSPCVYPAAVVDARRSSEAGCWRCGRRRAPSARVIVAESKAPRSLPEVRSQLPIQQQSTSLRALEELDQSDRCRSCDSLRHEGAYSITGFQHYMRDMEDSRCESSGGVERDQRGSVGGP